MDTSALNFIYFLAAIGAIYFILFLIKVLWSLLKLLIPAKNIRDSYGENCWAVVTGATDGIGLGFCEELAAFGINICLVSRNATKLAKTEAQLKKTHTSIQTRIITADFTECQQQGFFERIMEQLRDIEVGILVNNVGISNIGYIHEISPGRLINEINVNCVPMVILSNLIVQRMLQRESRSAIINLSSIAGIYPCPYVSTYSATKAFGDFFSKAIGMEYSGIVLSYAEKIDVLSVQPMKVESNMSRQQRSRTVATRNQCAGAALRSLGIDYETNGWWVHRFITWMTGCLPTFMIRFFSKLESKKIMEKEMERSRAPV